jgi:hypothetical protein
VFRIPLDGGAPSGLKTVGVPIDQMSFLEDAQGHLNVLLRAGGAGEGMWGSRPAGRHRAAALPLSALGDGREAAQREHYRRLPAPAWVRLQNRLCRRLAAVGWRARRAQGGTCPGEQPSAWALRHADAGEPQALDPGHAVERIEALGAHAVLVGNARRRPPLQRGATGSHQARLAGRHVQPVRRQGETRTHGFFYRPGADEGLLGLPVLGRAGRLAPGGGRMHARTAGAGLRHDAPDLRRRHAQHRRLPGALRARVGLQVDYATALGDDR